MLLESIVLPLNYTPTSAQGGRDLFLAFFVCRMLPAPFAEFFQFQLLIAHGFAFVGEIIGFLANLALQFDE